MRINYFREFIILSKYLNFSVAAERLFLTQPGLSRHISTLEKEIGVKLLERNTHTVKLTRKGKQFLNGIKKIIDDYDLLCDQVSTADTKQLHIGVPYFGVNAYLSPVILDFEETHPEIKLKLLAAYPEEIIDDLLSQKIDMAILPNVDFLNSKRLIFHDVFKEPLVLLLNKAHPLAQRQTVSIGELKKEDFISISGTYGKGLFEYTYDFCRQHSFEPKKLSATDTVESACLKMKPDSGVMLLPRHVKEANISSNINFVDVVDKDCFFIVSVVHHLQNQNPAVDEFIFCYRNHFSKNSSDSL